MKIENNLKIQGVVIMKIAVFADIHSNYPVFKKAYDQTKEMNIDKYIFLGDYVTDGFDGNKILDIIKNTDGYAINGNRESSIIDYHNGKNEDWNKYLQWNSMRYSYECLSKENIKYLETLDFFKIIYLENKKICLTHSTPYSLRDNVLKDSYNVFDKLINDFNCDIYLFGHEHLSFCAFYNNRYFINPGSIGMPSGDFPFKYGILTINGNDINYKALELEYDYKELYEYYTNSEFYKKAKHWCRIILACMKDGENHPTNFINLVNLKAKEKNIDVSKNIPDSLYSEVCELYFKGVK